MRRISVAGWSVLFIVSALVCASVAAPPATALQEVAWTASRPICWEYFRGEPPQDAHARTEAAAIHITVRWSLLFVIEYNQRTHRWNGSVEQTSIKVTNTMEPSLSWVVPGKEFPMVLNHEQRHFDLNEVYRRKLLLALSRLAADGKSAESVGKALRQAIDTTAGQVLESLRQIQDLYDTETVHGTDQVEQAKWNKMIDTWLNDPDQAP